MSDYYMLESGEEVDRIVLNLNHIPMILEMYSNDLELLLKESKDKKKLKEILMQFEFDLINEGIHYKPRLSDLVKVLPAVYQEPIEKFYKLFEKAESSEEYEFYYLILNYRLNIDQISKLKTQTRRLERQVTKLNRELNK